MQTAKTTVVHEGVNIDHIASTKPLDLHREFSIPPDTPIVGNVAALVSHKGQRYLLDAIALVIRKLPDAHFLIVGTGHLETALMEQIQRLNLRHRVTLTGFRPDVISLLKGLDLFVMSSVMEGLGTSLIESIMILIQFVPILFGLSIGIPIFFFGDWEYGLIVGALIWTIGGTVFLIVLGLILRLVGVEYDLQKQEAAYRKILVIAEDNETVRPKRIDELFDDVRKILFLSYLKSL